jgi:subtilisin family serine protease
MIMHGFQLRTVMVIVAAAATVFAPTPIIAADPSSPAATPQLVSTGSAATATTPVAPQSGDLRGSPAASIALCDHAPDRLLVQFKTSTATTARSKAIRAANVKQVRQLRLVPGLVVVQTSGDLSAAAAHLTADPGVLSVEPDCKLSLDLAPNDPSFSQLWGLSNTGQTGGTSGADIGATEAWNVRTDASSVTVAVIDTGIDTSHPDLAANLWTNPGEIPGNGIDDDGNGYVDDVHGWDFIHQTPVSIDDNGHGTHVAGTIGAVGNNAIGVTGVAWQARIMALKAFDSSGSASQSTVLVALDYAQANGAKIVNASFGGTDFVRAEYLAYQKLGAAGILTLAAAGNAGVDADERPHYPAAYDLPGIVSVAASTSSDTLASFSNHGVWNVDVAAPGEGILSTLPGGTYGTLSGTSMATPHVTGVAALVLAQHPGWTGQQVRDRILGTTRAVPALAGLTWTGGVISAANALSGVATVLPPPPTPQQVPLDGSVLSDPAPAPVAAPQPPALPATEAVDTSFADVFGPPTVAIGHDGTPYVAWSQRFNGIHVASLSGATWSDSRLTNAYDDLYWLDLAINPAGKPVVAFQRNWSSVAAYWDPGIVVATGGGAPAESRVTAACPALDACSSDWTPKFAIDGNGLEHVVFTRYQGLPQDGVPAPAGSAPQVPGNGLYYATNASGGWVVTRLTTNSDGPASIALAPDGSVDIVVRRRAGSATGLHLISNETGAWADTQLTMHVEDTSPQIAVAASGTVSVSFTRAPLGIYYLERVAQTWSGEDQVYAGPATDQDLALDPLGRPGIAFGLTDDWQTAAGVRLAQRRSGVWTVDAIADGQALLPSLAYGPDGSASVAWYQGWYGPGIGIRYATNASGSWTASEVTPSEPTPSVDQLAFASDALGHDHVLFDRGWGNPNSALIYGTNASGAWLFSQVGAGADTAAMTVDPDGTPHVVFIRMYDPTMGAPFPQDQRGAFYATTSADQWTIEKVADGEAISTSHPAIVSSPTGPEILLANRDGSQVELASRSAGTWSLATVLTTGNVRTINAVIEPGGTLDAAVGETRLGETWPQVTYLARTNGVWSTEHVTSDGVWHEAPRLALDANGEAWVVDYLPVVGGIELRHRAGGTWPSQTVTSDAAATTPAVGVDGAGNVHVVYDEGRFYGSSGCAVPECPGSGGLYDSVFNGDAWTRTRLTQYWLDFNPILASGGDGSLDALFLRNTLGIRRIQLSAGHLTAAVSRPAAKASAQGLAFGVQFSRPVVTLDSSDLAIDGTATGCSIGTPTGAGDAWSVPVTDCSDGTVILRLLADSVSDADGATGPSSDLSSAPVIVDATPPQARLTAPATPTAAATLTYSISMSEDVTGLDAADFSVGGTADGCVVGTPSGTGTSWSVDLVSCSEGTVSLTLKTNAVADGVGNLGPTTPAVAGTVTIVRPLAVQSFALQAASDTGRLSNDGLTNADTLAFDLEMSDTVTGLSSGDFQIAGTATGCSIAVVGAGAAYVVTVSDCTEGTVDLTLAANTVAHNATQGPSDPASAPTVTIDRSSPAIAVGSSPSSGSTAASPTISLTLGSSEALDCGTVSTAPNVDFATSGLASFGAVSGTGTPTCAVAATAAVAQGQQGSVSVGLGANFSMADDAGNVATTATGLPITVHVDRQPPTVSAPTIALRVAAKLVGTALPVTVGWAASDAGGSGVASYRLSRSVDAGKTWTTVTLQATAFTTSIPSSGSIRFKVVAIDVVGNESTEAVTSISGALAQQTAAKFSGAWSTTRSTTFSGGSDTWARANGASATYTFTGRAFALVTVRGPGRGKVRLTIDGVSTTVDLGASTTSYRYVAWKKAWSTSGKHTVKVVCLGTSGRPRVDVDAFAIVK